MFVFRRFFLPRPLSSRLLGKSFLPCPIHLSMFLSYRTTITLFAEVPSLPDAVLHTSISTLRRKPGMLLQISSRSNINPLHLWQHLPSTVVETSAISNQTRHRSCANVNRKTISSFPPLATHIPPSGIIQVYRKDSTHTIHVASRYVNSRSSKKSSISWKLVESIC